MRVMAFDIGLKRIGVAVTDPLQIIATSVGTYSGCSILFRYISQT